VKGSIYSRSALSVQCIITGAVNGTVGIVGLSEFHILSTN